MFVHIMKMNKENFKKLIIIQTLLKNAFIITVMMLKGMHYSYV